MSKRWDYPREFRKRNWTSCHLFYHDGTKEFDVRNGSRLRNSLWFYDGLKALKEGYYGEF